MKTKVKPAKKPRRIRNAFGKFFRNENHPRVYRLITTISLALAVLFLTADKMRRIKNIDPVNMTATIQKSTKPSPYVGGVIAFGVAVPLTLAGISVASILRKKRKRNQA